jgi:hypothetical protein
MTAPLPRNWMPQIHRTVARALLLVPEHDISREWWTWVPSPSEPSLAALEAATGNTHRAGNRTANPTRVNLAFTGAGVI